MDQRKKDILKAIVENYIETAEPVGSKTLSSSSGIEFSPATLRHEMALLEEQGYLEHPHTSAGRVPTPQGYRLYVDDLMHRHRIGLDEMRSINEALRLRINEYDRLLEEAGRTVSRLTRYTAISAAPKRESPVFIKLEIFLSDPGTLVFVAVLEGGVVRNKLTRLFRSADPAAVRQLGDAMNATLLGRGLPGDAAAERCAALAGSGAEYLPLALEFMRESALSAEKREVYLAGESQLLDHPEFRDVSKARSTLEYLSEHRDIDTLAPAAPNEQVRITIGPENLAEALRETSVISAFFPMGEGSQGMIGLVGPTRMDYSRLASRLSYIASRLGTLLMQDEEDNS